jgi:hypothetical protein
MNHAGASFQNRVRPSEGWYNISRKPSRRESRDVSG